MSLAGLALRGIGCVAIGAGYSLGVVRRIVAGLPSRYAAGRGWRTHEAGALRLRVPPDWGRVERLDGGGFVVHNRPREHRVEGDAVWYGSAIELMLGPPDPLALPALAPMREYRREIATPSGGVAISLRIANGVTARRRREALRVLRLVRPIR